MSENSQEDPKIIEEQYSWENYVFKFSAGGESESAADNHDCHQCNSKSVKMVVKSIFDPIGDFFRCDDCGQRWIEPRIWGKFEFKLEFVACPESYEKGRIPIWLTLPSCWDVNCFNCKLSCKAREFPLSPRRFSYITWCKQCDDFGLFVSTVTEDNFHLRRMAIIDHGNEHVPSGTQNDFSMTLWGQKNFSFSLENGKLKVY